MIVGATREADGRWLVVGQNGGAVEHLTDAEFRERFEPASADDLLRAAAVSTNGATAAPPTPTRRPAQRKAVTAARKPNRPAANHPRRQQGTREVAAATKRRGRGDLKPEQWAQGCVWWIEGVPVAEIAERLGVSDAGVRYRAKVDRWPARPSQQGRHGAGKKATETPSRRCHACQQRTTADPCQHCQTPWKQQLDD